VPIYTPPSLSAVDGDLLAYTKPTITPEFADLAAYTVPSLSAVDGALVLYTAPVFNFLDRELLDPTAASRTLTLGATEPLDVAAFALTVTGGGASLSFSMAASEPLDVAAFAIDGAAPDVAPKVGAGRASKGKRRRVTVEIDGETFDVASAEEARQLLTQAREVAQEAAPRAVAEAKRPEAVIIPHVVLVQPDYASEFFQQLQAQIDATNAAIAAVYRDAVAAQALVARQQAEAIIAQRIADDEDDIESLLAMGYL